MVGAWRRQTRDSLVTSASRSRRRRNVKDVSFLGFWFGQSDGQQCHSPKWAVLEVKWAVGKAGRWGNDRFSLKVLNMKSIWTYSDVERLSDMRSREEASGMEAELEITSLSWQME